MTRGQMLRKLQLAVDHIDAVIQECAASTVGPLAEALDLIHQAESEIEHDDA